MANIILVAGTFHGGWYWDPILPTLKEAGHNVFTPTLSGLKEENEHKPINLETHIEDVLKIIEDNLLADVILLGWSYAGMVITGVADRARTKIQKLIYLDAQLPKTGQCEFDLMPEQDRNSTLSECLDGLNIYPNEWLQKYELRTKPHPLATKLQPLNYDQAKFDSIEKIFIFAEKWFHNPEVISPIKRSYELASQTPGWELHVWPYGHDLVREAPEFVLKLLLEHADSI